MAPKLSVCVILIGIFHLCSCFLVHNTRNIINQQKLVADRKYILKRFLHGCPFAFPCPPPFCDNPVFGPHDCCGSCPDPEPEPEPESTSPANQNNPIDGADATRIPSTTLPPTTPDCPQPCTYNGQHYCHHFPCHITCIDAISPPDSCCEVCPNGPNCGYNGHTIPEGQNITLPSGENVFCSEGGIYGGSTVVTKPIIG